MNQAQVATPKTKQHRPEYSSVKWGPVFAVSATIMTYFVAIIGASLLLGLGLNLAGWDEQRALDFFNESVVAQFSQMALYSVIALAIVFWLVKRFKASVQDIGLVRPRLKDVWLALGGFIAYLPLYIITIAIVRMLVPGLDIDQEQEIGFSTQTTGVALIFVFISLVILAPVMEEILMRGFLFTGLRSKLRYVIAAIITSVLFGIAHLQFGSGNPLLWVAGIDTFVLSLVLVHLRETTGSLWSPIGLHMIKNGIAFYVLFFVR